MFILSSVLFRCYEWGINVNFSDPTSAEFIPLVKSTFPSLTGKFFFIFFLLPSLKMFPFPGILSVNLAVKLD